VQPLLHNRKIIFEQVEQFRLNRYALLQSCQYEASDFYALPLAPGAPDDNWNVKGHAGTLTAGPALRKIGHTCWQIHGNAGFFSKFAPAFSSQGIVGDETSRAEKPTGNVRAEAPIPGFSR
jgi:hypothetical protein